MLKLVICVLVLVGAAAALSCSGSSSSSGPPSVQILSPTSGEAFTVAEKVPVLGAALDPIDGQITSPAALAWTIGGIVDPVGEGISDQVGPFDAGTYTLTFSATNSRREKGQASVDFVVH
jgi:hypothetical protein